MLNRHGRAFSGPTAYPEPPRLIVPEDLKDAVDRQALEPDDDDQDD